MFMISGSMHKERLSSFASFEANETVERDINMSVLDVLVQVVDSVRLSLALPYKRAVRAVPSSFKFNHLRPNRSITFFILSPNHNS